MKIELDLDGDGIADVVCEADLKTISKVAMAKIVALAGGALSAYWFL